SGRALGARPAGGRGRALGARPPRPAAVSGRSRRVPAPVRPSARPPGTVRGWRAGDLPAAPGAGAPARPDGTRAARGTPAGSRPAVEAHALPGAHYPGVVTIRLYDTSARQIRDFTPLQPGCVSIYLCGATVQAAPHIGHIRSGLNFDIMRRWFEYRGLDVTFIRNVTDIDDKIIAKSAEQGRPWWAIGYENERAFTDGYQALGCLPPTYEPRATGHITEMVEMMRGLIERGHAYEADGNVYFAVTSCPEYLSLSNQELENLLQPSGEGETGKRDPRDFAMWKAAKPGEPSWETPWGRGRPGWHLECSAMAHKYLGSAFDIHGGGLDLIFPHHENEIAQARGYGDAFARYWVHNAWVTMSGEKMSKSLGNSVLVSEMVKRWRPIVLRYYL